MYNKNEINKLIAFINSQNGLHDKRSLQQAVCSAFALIKERSVFRGRYFALRFCKAANSNFSNTVLSLSALKKYDSLPFIICLVTPKKNYLMLANTTFLHKISHSSQELRIDNIKGSFNGSDIMRDYGGFSNNADNFEFLFPLHQNFTFEENLARLVENTNNIHPTGHRFVPTDEQKFCILKSVQRTINFINSKEYQLLSQDLQRRVNKVEKEIVATTLINNVNLRGRFIEYLITADDNEQTKLADALQHNSTLPQIFTADRLGDYEYKFQNFRTATDIKSKTLFLSSNPKGFNIDKLLSFLAEENSVYLLYIIGIDENKKIHTRLCSIYNRQLLEKTRIIKHWAGRNSRGVTQYDGTALEDIIFNFDNTIDTDAATNFLKQCLSS